MRWAQLNVMADPKAKQRLAEFALQESEVKLSSFHGKGWSCWLGKKMQRLYETENTQIDLQKKAREYWPGKNKFTYKQFDTMD